MKRFPIILGMVMILAFFGWASAQTTAKTAAAGDDGAKVFEANKCNMCHSVESKAIEKKMKSTSPTAPPDLSDVGSQHDVAWFKDWLLQKNELNGKKHPKKWTGTDADLQKLADWLATLKKAAK